MKVRNIIKIDEERCDGCGLCIPNCPEGALQIINGKAKLVKESFCDGLGACLGECPRGALTIEKRESEGYDEAGAIAHIRESSLHLVEKQMEHLKQHLDELPERSQSNFCPANQTLQWGTGSGDEAGISSQLHQWPVQLHLVSPQAPYFKNADLVLIADCVPFAYANLHEDFLLGKAVIIGCPKFDDVDAYIEKVYQIIENANIRSLTAVHMEVPCCSGLVYLAKKAIGRTNRKIPFEAVQIGIKGDVIERTV